MLCVLNGRRRRRMHGVQNDACGLFAADERECRTVVRHISRGDLFERCLQPWLLRERIRCAVPASSSVTASFRLRAFTSVESR